MDCEHDSKCCTDFLGEADKDRDGLVKMGGLRSNDGREGLMGYVSYRLSRSNIEEGINKVSI